MKLRTISLGLVACAIGLLFSGCDNAPGKPKDIADAVRPEQVKDFAVLYGQNCAACHGDQGTNGAAISLANPIYLAFAGAANMQRVIGAGVKDTSMPAFAKSSGGMLTDAQIAILVQGMIQTWGDAGLGKTPVMPTYTSTAPGDAARGQVTFTSNCARCHGADGAGVRSDSTQAGASGSIVDPSYLALVSDQGLRSIVVAGMPGMPDWRSHKAGAETHALTEQEIADLVVWLAAQRVATPGQPYQTHP